MAVYASLFNLLLTQSGGGEAARKLELNRWEEKLARRSELVTAMKTTS